MANLFQPCAKLWSQMDMMDGEAMRTGIHQTVVSLSSQPTPVDWNDSYFFNNYVQPLSKKIRPTSDEAANQAKAFLKFYARGEDEEEKISEVIACLWYYMTID